MATRGVIGQSLLRGAADLACLDGIVSCLLLSAGFLSFVRVHSSDFFVVQRITLGNCFWISIRHNLHGINFLPLSLSWRWCFLGDLLTPQFQSPWSTIIGGDTQRSTESKCVVLKLHLFTRQLPVCVCTSSSREACVQQLESTLMANILKMKTRIHESYCVATTHTGEITMPCENVDKSTARIKLIGDKQTTMEKDVESAAIAGELQPLVALIQDAGMTIDEDIRQLWSTQNLQQVPEKALSDLRDFAAELQATDKSKREAVAIARLSSMINRMQEDAFLIAVFASVAFCFVQPKADDPEDEDNPWTKARYLAGIERQKARYLAVIRHHWPDAVVTHYRLAYHTPQHLKYTRQFASRYSNWRKAAARINLCTLLRSHTFRYGGAVKDPFCRGNMELGRSEKSLPKLDRALLEIRHEKLRQSKFGVDKYGLIVEEVHALQPLPDFEEIWNLAVVWEEVEEVATLPASTATALTKSPPFKGIKIE